jgi:ubiquinone/menaquinone biosynthesis C-methylase UbiE
MDVFYELFQTLPRQGPGNYDCTKRAFESIPKLPAVPKILDIGCGTGIQTIDLAKLSGGNITALDNYEPFLEIVLDRARSAGLEARITTKNGSMFELDFTDISFDIIWAEGSIYIMGFEKGLQDWRKFIRTNGYLAVSELSWLKPEPPEELIIFWRQEYPGIKTINENLEIIERTGYKLLDYFVEPDEAWWNDLYGPLEDNVKKLRKKYKGNSKALEVIDNTEREIQLFKEYSDWYGYVFFVMQKKE